jgi:hypothetical protein
MSLLFNAAVSAALLLMQRFQLLRRCCCKSGAIGLLPERK